MRNEVWTHQLGHDAPQNVVGFGQICGQACLPTGGFRRGLKVATYLPLHLGVTTGSINITQLTPQNALGSG